jgi:hypothetical protein
VKILCAWCGSTIQVRCNHCNAPLVAASVLGGTFGFYGDAMICLNGETPVVFAPHSIEKMDKTYGLCDACAELPADERDALIKIRRTKDRSIPDDSTLSTLMQEIEAANKHERETRAINRQKTKQELRPNEPRKKRGPTGVTRSATTRAESERQK